MFEYTPDRRHVSVIVRQSRRKVVTIPPNFTFDKSANHFLVLLFVQVHLVNLLILGI